LCGPKPHGRFDYSYRHVPAKTFGSPHRRARYASHVQQTVELERRIHETIAASGPIRFDEYMRRALYEPELGYYVRGLERAGRGGDFVTSPALSPAFGRTLARLVPILAESVPDGPLRIIDAGAGEGGLIRAIAPAARRLAPDRSLEMVLVEPGAAQRDRTLALLDDDAGAVEDAAALARLPPASGLIIANELFDALPVRRFRRQPRLEEVWVASDGAGLTEAWRPATPPVGLGRIPRERECCVAVGAESLLAALASSLERGLLLIVDYGYPASTLYALDGPGNPLRGFRAGTLVDSLVKEPGAVDLTAHVDFTRLARAAVAEGFETVFFTDQTYLLLALGFLDDPDAAAARRLMHPEDMGGSFKCLLLAKGIDAEVFRALGVRDRRRLLVDPAAPHK